MLATLIQQSSRIPLIARAVSFSLDSAFMLLRNTATSSVSSPRISSSAYWLVKMRIYIVKHFSRPRILLRFRLKSSAIRSASSALQASIGWSFLSCRSISSIEFTLMIPLIKLSSYGRQGGRVKPSPKRGFITLISSSFFIIRPCSTGIPALRAGWGRRVWSRTCW